MTQSNVNYFLDDPAKTARSLEVPNANFANGVNGAASNACGIGIGFDETDLEGSNAQFTLLDQRGNARAPQTSQLIGGNGLGKGVSGILPESTIREGIIENNGDGTITPLGNATLETLNAGWVSA